MAPSRGDDLTNFSRRSRVVTTPATTPATCNDAVRIVVDDREPLHWKDRHLDMGLFSIALFAVLMMGLVETLSAPQLTTRFFLGICHRVAAESGIRNLYEIPATWKGWYSLEIGIEITAAIVLGFLVWLLFALLYDSAGVIIGMVPASVASIITMIFRLRLQSYVLLSIFPIVVFNSLIAARILDKRWHDRMSEKEMRRYHRQAARSARGTNRRNSHSSGVGR